jgi:hypothetical protein
MYSGEKRLAACILRIELDEPRKVYVDGEKVTGQVHVTVEKQTNCKALEITTGWSTHGRGNVDRGEGAVQEVFQGTWQAGEYRYPFALATAAWPPTYYGRTLNVSHHVQAQAKLAWATDPKTLCEISVGATTAPTDLAPSRKQTSWGLLGWLIGLPLLILLGSMFFFLIPILLMAAGLVWFFTSYVPRSRTGPVLCRVQPASVSAGQACECTLEFTPKRKLSVNSVTATLVGEEKCVSGSGSNRKTYQEELQRTEERFLEATHLAPGQKQSFQTTIQLPQAAAPSMKLSDNEVNWSIEFRIDIPRWPDFVEKVPVIVAPSATFQEAVARVPGEPTWLEQVLEQLRQSAQDPQRLELVLSAIAADDFEIALDIEEPTASPAQATALRGGTWLATYDELHDFDCSLHVPEGEPIPKTGTTWRGRIRIVGYEPEEERLIAVTATT